MRCASAVFAALILTGLADPAAAQKRRAPPTCSKELGTTGADQLVRDCREASPMTPALCRADVPCDALRDLIREACETPGAEARAACANLDDEADDDGEDE